MAPQWNRDPRPEVPVLPLVRPTLVPVLLAAAAMVYACGPRPQAAGGTQARKGGASQHALTSSLGVNVTDRVQLDFRITNGLPRAVEVNFPSGHTHDFTVTDTTGREIWKWSEGRAFTQAMQNRVLQRDETLSYHAAWNPGSRRGTFLAVVSLNSNNHPVEERVRFIVP